MPTRQELLDSLSIQKTALVSYVSSLSDEELSCDCTESEFPGGAPWRVIDHLTHLVESERVLLMLAQQGVEAHKSRDSTISARAEAFREGFFGHIHEVNQVTVEAQRSLSAEEALAIMDEARSETLRYLEALSDEDLGLPEPQFPFSDGTVGGTLAVIAMHHQMHGDWIRRGLESPGQTQPESVP